MCPKNPYYIGNTRGIAVAQNATTTQQNSLR